MATTREKIAPRPSNPFGESDKRHAAFEHGVTATLAIPEIEEALKLREKAKSGKLVELSEDQAWPKDPFYPIEALRLQSYIELCDRSGFRRVEVKG